MNERAVSEMASIHKAISSANDMTWQEKSAAIEQAFSELPIKTSEGRAIPAGDLIRGIGRLLLIAQGNPPRETLPPKEGLKKLESAASHLLEIVDKIQPTTIESLNLTDGTWRDFQTKLRLVAVGAKFAQMPDTRGAPRKVQAQRIREEVAKFYEFMTGRRASVNFDQREGERKDYGEFVEFLGRIFNILGIEASPASQARTRNKKVKQAGR